MSDRRHDAVRTEPDPGLCGTCAHARIITSSRRARFHMCCLAETDSRFRRYPVLPVRSCAGYQRRTELP
jgi:hypothetical protein